MAHGMPVLYVRVQRSGRALVSEQTAYPGRPATADPATGTGVSDPVAPEAAAGVPAAAPVQSEPEAVPPVSQPPRAPRVLYSARVGPGSEHVFAAAEVAALVQVTAMSEEHQPPRVETERVGGEPAQESEPAGEPLSVGGTNPTLEVLAELQRRQAELREQWLHRREELQKRQVEMQRQFQAQMKAILRQLQAGPDGSGPG